MGGGGGKANGNSGKRRGDLYKRGGRGSGRREGAEGEKES